MPKPKGGLGRGLNSLIPSGAQGQGQAQEQGQEAQAGTPVQREIPGIADTQPDGAATEQGHAGLLYAPVDSISPNPHQPRGVFNEANLEELASSIREHGVLQPLVVTQMGAGRYNLIAGERRWRASRLAGLDSVPVIVKEATSREMLELALVENLQRADLNPLEEAAAYRSLIDDFDLKQEEVAVRVGRSRGAVTNSLRLLRLPPAIQEALASGAISEGHARAILQVPDAENQLILAERIVSEGLNVRQAEAYARRLSEQAEAGEEEAATDEEAPLYDHLRHLEDQFRNALGTKVQLSKSRRGGRLVIYFYSDEELERIYGAIIHEE